MNLKKEESQSTDISSDEEYLTRCVVDTVSRKFMLYSSEGNEKIVHCDSVEEFMNVLQFVRATINEDNIAELAYSSLL